MTEESKQPNVISLLPNNKSQFTYSDTSSGFDDRLAEANRRSNELEKRPGMTAAEMLEQSKNGGGRRRTKRRRNTNKRRTNKRRTNKRRTNKRRK